MCRMVFCLKGGYAKALEHLAVAKGSPHFVHPSGATLGAFDCDQVKYLFVRGKDKSRARCNGSVSISRGFQFLVLRL